MSMTHGLLEEEIVSSKLRTGIEIACIILRDQYPVELGLSVNFID